MLLATGSDSWYHLLCSALQGGATTLVFCFVVFLDHLFPPVQYPAFLGVTVIQYPLVARWVMRWSQKQCCFRTRLCCQVVTHRHCQLQVTFHSQYPFSQTQRRLLGFHFHPE